MKTSTARDDRRFNCDLVWLGVWKTWNNYGWIVFLRELLLCNNSSSFSVAGTYRLHVVIKLSILVLQNALVTDAGESNAGDRLSVLATPRKQTKTFADGMDLFPPISVSRSLGQMLQTDRTGKPNRPTVLLISDFFEWIIIRISGSAFHIALVIEGDPGKKHSRNVDMYKKKTIEPIDALPPPINSPTRHVSKNIKLQQPHPLFDVLTWLPSSNDFIKKETKFSYTFHDPRCNLKAISLIN